jgi:hypothetical protein
VVVNVAILASQLMDNESFEPMHGSAYDAPQPAADTTVAGGTLHVGPVEKCNGSSDNVISVGMLSWRRVSPTVQFVPGGSFAVVREPGCATIEFDNRVPAELSPGVWELHGDEQAIGPNNEVQRLGWRTEPFEVAGG